MKYCYRHSAVVMIMITVLSAEQHFVLPGGTLRAAIAMAHPGDTIVVSSGIYNGNIILSKRLSLIGSDNAVLRGDGKGSVVTVNADSCVIRNIIVENTGRDLLYEDAGILLLSDHNTVQHSVIRNTLFGIYIKQSDGNTIANTTITSFRDLDQGQRGSGIHVWNSHRNNLIGNSISHARDGIYIQNANHTYIADNNVHSLRYGLHYMYADSNTFLRNSFYDNVAGAAVMYTRNIVMKHNLFLRNRGFASYGILLQDCHFSFADSNIIADNVTGIFMEASTNNLFNNNIIAQNDFAMQMYQNSINNVFTGNSFIDNLNPLTLVGKRTDSHWSRNHIGNYWSAYEGYDLDADGIGDIPMRIQNVFNYIEGKNANVRLYLYSPASQALALSAKAFPIIDINNEIDTDPLTTPGNIEWAYDLLQSIPGSEKRTTRGNTAAGFIFISLTVAVGFIIIHMQRKEQRR
jgi:nitrous oxidase accessory protein